MEEHWQYLRAAIDNREPSLFTCYVDWLRSRNEKNPSWTWLSNWLRERILERLSPEDAELALQYLKEADNRPQTNPGPFLLPSNPLFKEATLYLDALMNGQRERAWAVVMQAVEAGASIKDIYLHILQPVQYEVGRLWQLNHVSFMQEHYGTAATQTLMAQLQPRIFSTPRIGKHVLIAGLGGGLHELGPRMLSDFLEMEGWDTRFVGAGHSPAQIASLAKDMKPDLVCLSCTMTEHIRPLKESLSAVRDSAPGTRILAGGRPFLLGFALWKSVGADGFAPDGAAAARLAKSMLIDS